MIFKKCALGRIVNTFDEKKYGKPEPGFKGSTGFSAIVSGDKLTPLQPEKYGQHGLKGFMRRFRF